jgi:LCP family protein required for cell wall assembly
MSDDNATPRKYRGAGKRRLGGLPFHKRHRKLIVGLLSVLLVAGVAIGGYAYNLNRQFNNIARVDSTGTLDEEERPDPDKGNALNVLLLGSDRGETSLEGYQDTTLSEDAANPEWPAGKYRSDTIMVLHISADRKSVYLISIPRDTLTMIYDENGDEAGMAKINSAFSDYGPAGAISTVEHLTDLRMKHLAVIDWDGFKDLSKAVGGVRVYIPYTSYDSNQDITWEKGWKKLQGKRALQYVRTRHGLVRGDFERIERQQNFIRALMKKMLSSGTLTNPVKLTNTLGAVTSNLTVDQQWESGDIRALALSLRGISADDVTFMTAPIAGTETVDPYGSIVRLKEQQSEELYQAVRRDRVDRYLRKYPDATNKAPEDEEGAEASAG